MPMNLCVCSESRKRFGSAFAASTASATFSGLLPSGCRKIGVCGPKRSVHSRGNATVDDQFGFVCAPRHAGVEPLFRRDRQPNVGRKLGVERNRAVRLDMDAPAVGTQRCDERERLALRKRFSAGDHDHRTIAADFANACDDVVDRREKLERVVGVAEVAREIAAREAHENGGRSGVAAFALQAVEDLDHLQH